MEPLNVLMVGTGEYTTGWVGTGASGSDKKVGVVGLSLFDLRRREKVNKLSMVGVNGKKFPAIREHLQKNIGQAYNNLDTSFTSFPADDKVEPEAYKTAIGALKPGDAITIFTPDPTHYPIARYAIERGIHVMITKPAVQVLAQHQELVELAQKHGVYVYIEHHKRFDPAYADARHKAQSLGDFNYFYSYMSQPKSQLETFKAWAGKDSDISYYLNSHHVDICDSMVQSRGYVPLRVTGNSSKGVALDLGCDPATEDTISVMVTWGKKDDPSKRAVGVYTASWTAPQRAGVHSNQYFHYLAANGEIRIDQAKRGYDVADDSVGQLAWYNPFYMRYAPDEDGNFAGQTGYGYISMEKFVDGCRAVNSGKAKPEDLDKKDLPTLKNTIATTAILEAGRRSIDEGREIKIVAICPNPYLSSVVFCDFSFITLFFCKLYFAGSSPSSFRIQRADWPFMGDLATLSLDSLESLPLGYRFRPTDVELVDHYLRLKINGKDSEVQVIPEVDVCKCEPWDLPGLSVIKTDDREWFFFCPRDRKYPNGHRSNRATLAGYWKATGKDRTIKYRTNLIGMKKTLVFYRGRAPKGERTNWIMHEYRATTKELDGTNPGQSAFVLCRLFRKSEEKVGTLKCDEVEVNGLSPITTKPSPGETPSELASVHETPNSDTSVGSQPAGVNSWQVDSSNMTPDPPLPTESHCNSYIASDLEYDLQMGPWQEEDFKPFFESSFEQLDNKAFSTWQPDVKKELGHSFVDSFFASEFVDDHSWMQFQDGASEQDISISDVLDALSCEDSTSPNKLILENETETSGHICTLSAGPRRNGFTKDGGSSSDTDTDVQLEASKWLGEQVGIKPSFQMQTAMQSYRSEAASIDHPLVLQCLSGDDTVGSSAFSSGFLMEPFNKFEGSTSHYSPVNNSGSYVGTGIKIRARQPSTHNNVNQGTAPRRLRLQLARESVSCSKRKGSGGIAKDPEGKLAVAEGERMAESTTLDGRRENFVETDKNKEVRKPENLRFRLGRDGATGDNRKKTQETFLETDRNEEVENKKFMSEGDSGGSLKGPSVTIGMKLHSKRVIRFSVACKIGISVAAIVFAVFIGFRKFL